MYSGLGLWTLGHLDACTLLQPTPLHPIGPGVGGCLTEQDTVPEVQPITRVISCVLNLTSPRAPGCHAGGSEGTVGARGRWEGGGRWERGEGSGVLNENIPHWAPQKALTAAHAASRAGGQRPVLYSAGHRARARRQGCPRPTTDPGPPTTGSLAARNTLIPMKCFRGWFALVISTCLGCRGRVVPSMV